MNYLGQLSHPHLVKLIGYCFEDEDRLLVYEFMPRGSLEYHLFMSEFFISHLFTLFNFWSVPNIRNINCCNRRLVFSTSFLGSPFESCSWRCQRACISSQCWNKSDIPRFQDLKCLAGFSMCPYTHDNVSWIEEIIKISYLKIPLLIWFRIIMQSLLIWGWQRTDQHVRKVMSPPG